MLRCKYLKLIAIFLSIIISQFGFISEAGIFKLLLNKPTPPVLSKIIKTDKQGLIQIAHK